MRNRDSSVGIATGYGWMAGVQFPVWAGDLSLRRVYTGSEAHPDY
jgi:hypothetical protein